MDVRRRTACMLRCALPCCAHAVPNAMPRCAVLCHDGSISPGARSQGPSPSPLPHRCLAPSGAANPTPPLPLARSTRRGRRSGWRAWRRR
jgi:hypothetical protein